MTRHAFRRATMGALAVATAAVWLGSAEVARPSEPAERPAGPTAVLSCEDWTYTFEVRGYGTRSEGWSGRLSYSGQAADATSLSELAVNDYLHTPWGTLYYVGEPPEAWAGRGWSPMPLAGQPAGERRLLPGAGADLWLGADDNGGRAAVRVGQTVRLELPPGPAGLVWSAPADLPEQLAIRSGWRTIPLPPGWMAAERVQVFRLQSLAPGEATLRLTLGSALPAATPDHEPTAEWRFTFEVFPPVSVPPPGR